MTRAFLGSVFAVLLSLPGVTWAGAVIQSMQGDVRAGTGKQVLFAARADQRLAAGTTVVTGADAQAILKFDDGAQMVLGQNTEFRIVDSQYVASQPQADRAVFDLVRGALRVVTGFIGQRSRQSFALRSPQMTIGIRGTDFMVAIVNPLFVNVLQGSIATANTAGTVVFGQGAIGSVASSAALAVPIPAAALPPAASGAFGNLAAAKVAAAVTPAAASGVAAGAATGAVAAPTAGVGAAVAIGVGAAIIGTAIDEGEKASTSHH
jgi:hypothetical protein